MFADLTLNGAAYGWLMLAGIVISIVLWSRTAQQDPRLLFIYVAGLIGAFLGGKVVYILAEGWLHYGQPDFWQQIATGKTVLGALLGGYGGVELAKWQVGYRAATGDRFALIAPIGIMTGRVGCLVHGCCLGKACAPAWYTLNDVHGIARWPAVPLEIAFNAVAVTAFFILRRGQWLPGQHFHLYLMGYGVFRFVHEIYRNTPAIAGPFSGYQFAALAVAMLGLNGFCRRRLRPAPPATDEIVLASSGGPG